MNWVNKGRVKALERIAKAKKQNSILLDLSFLGIRELPEELFELVNLTDLDLSNNGLSHLPTGINKLKNLQNLNLSNNVFNYTNGLGFTFPCSLSIQSLDLSCNLLHKIPDDLYFLENLEDVNIDFNPITEGVPEEILDDGIEAIANFQEAIQMGVVA